MNCKLCKYFVSEYMNIGIGFCSYENMNYERLYDVESELNSDFMECEVEK